VVVLVSPLRDAFNRGAGVGEDAVLSSPEKKEDKKKTWATVLESSERKRLKASRS